MKRFCLLFLVLTGVAVAQEQVAPAPTQAPMQRTTNRMERSSAPTYTDLNCAGFISKETYNRGNYILSGSESPAATQFTIGDTIFLEGSGYTEGERYSVLRELRDPNRNSAFPGQSTAIAALGQPFQELGHVKVVAMRGKTAIAKIEFSCTAMVAGDLIVPYAEKQSMQYHDAPFEQFPAGAGSVNGRIVMAKEFDIIVSNGQKVYLNVGSSQGLKVGDYFRAVRSYDPDKQHKVEALEYKTQQTEDTMKNQVKITPGSYASLPRRALGEMIVLSVTPTSATAMITYSLEHINVGDLVELEGAAAPQQ